MGDNQSLVNSAPTVKRRSQVLRSLISRLRGGAPTTISHETGNTCSGPSFLHNFLPILEPFLLLDPRLKYIEDRIIGRQPSSGNEESYKPPSSINGLRTLIESNDTPCDCDECAPELYQLGKNSSHEAVRYQLPYARATFKGFQKLCSEIPSAQPKLSLRFYGEYEAMRFVRHHVAWLDNTYLKPTSKTDSLPVLQLQSLLDAWNPNLIGSDMRQTMSSTQQLHLISVLNQIFFFGALPPHRASISAGFSWLPDSNKSCFGICTFNPIIGTQVLLHPTLYRHNGNPGDPDVRWRNRLGTLLHELCHAFLKAYTCRSCPMHEQCIGPRGHGRAWQLLAAKMEEVATKLLGGFVDFGRYQSMLHDLEGSGKLPSQHDLEVLRFGARWKSEGT